jgi:RHS repeat-associated protein
MLQYALDIDTNLLTLRRRLFGPSWERFLSQDPIGFNAGDPNLYRYVRNSAVTHVDPQGLGDLISLPRPRICSWSADAAEWCLGITALNFAGDLICTATGYNCERFTTKFKRYSAQCEEELKKLGSIAFIQKYSDCGRVSAVVSQVRNCELCCIMHAAKDAGEDMEWFANGFPSCVGFVLNFYNSPGVPPVFPK